ncbi:hypothetical protein BT69DRAFT_1288061 [Atractiella rhizophila]|nr:hypothetical protein BT69DRAFT_1288061 [Atractiella rhizophila]
MTRETSPKPLSRARELLSKAAAPFTVVLPPRAVPTHDDLTAGDYETTQPSLLSPSNPAFTYERGEGPNGGILVNRRRVRRKGAPPTSPAVSDAPPTSPIATEGRSPRRSSTIHFAPLPTGKPKNRSNSISLGVSARASLINGSPGAPLTRTLSPERVNSAIQAQKEDGDTKFVMRASELAKEAGRTGKDGKEEKREAGAREKKKTDGAQVSVPEEEDTVEEDGGDALRRSSTGTFSVSEEKDEALSPFPSSSTTKSRTTLSGMKERMEARKKAIERKKHVLNGTDGADNMEEVDVDVPADVEDEEGGEEADESEDESARRSKIVQAAATEVYHRHRKSSQGSS